MRGENIAKNLYIKIGSVSLCHGLSEHLPFTQRQTALLRPIYPVSVVVGS